MSEDRKTPESNNASAKPTGKRQLSGVATSNAAAANTVSTSGSGDSEKPGGGPLRFFPEVISEIRKVIWPTAREMVVYTVVVFAFLIILTALVAGVDFAAGLGVEKIFTR